MKKRLLIGKEELVVTAYKSGAGLRDIAKLHDVSVGTISRILDALEVNRRKQGRPRRTNGST